MKKYKRLYINTKKAKKHSFRNKKKRNQKVNLVDIKKCI